MGTSMPPSKQAFEQRSKPTFGLFGVLGNPRRQPRVATLSMNDPYSSIAVVHSAVFIRPLPPVAHARRRDQPSGSHPYTVSANQSAVFVMTRSALAWSLVRTW